jgi:peptidoglycan/LPS O-acetylase OafA/YrhL
MVPVAVHYLNYQLNAKALKEILLSVSFLQSWVPSYPLVLNSPAWSISVEMLFYLTFPFFLLLLNKNRNLFVSIAVVLFLLAQYFHLKYYTARWSLPDSIVDTVFFNPVVHLSQFLIGMIGGYIYANNRTLMPRSNWLAAGLLLLIVLLLIYRPDNVSYQVGLIAPVFMVFILSIAVNDARFLNMKWFVFLGEISYGIYILQFPVFKFLENVNKHHMQIPNQYFFFLALGALLFVSALSYKFIEKPLRRKINSLKTTRVA